ncbi:hypothetical protein HanIR_Chr02g0071381 [Helianthus annuus]|nr:hypothetical protein HanIR_Chr02g0071381 [Helianthus annuus]
MLDMATQNLIIFLSCHILTPQTANKDTINSNISVYDKFQRDHRALEVEDKL